jgi:hypothetical protein
LRLLIADPVPHEDCGSGGNRQGKNDENDLWCSAPAITDHGTIVFKKLNPMLRPALPHRRQAMVGRRATHGRDKLDSSGILIGFGILFESVPTGGTSSGFKTCH